MKIELNKKKLLTISLLVVFIVISSSVVIGYLKKHNKQETETVVINRNNDQIENILRRKIDGQAIDLAEQSNFHPVAVMVENSADAWPLSGLDKANIVFEAITEASIPRYVALFANDQVIEKIGPVRSARPYYLDWIAPYQPLYMHVGGSPQALQKLHSGLYSITDFDQFYYAKYFWRDKWRYAPHNVYTSSELIKNAVSDKKMSEITYQPWLYKNDLELAKRPTEVNDVAINFASQYYKVKWQYNREENNYLRYQNGEIHKMSNGEWIKAKNVIVQVNNMKVIDEVGRKEITTIGEGPAWVFRDGETIIGKWQKKTKEEMIRYYDDNNKEIELNGGSTWIEVIPKEDNLKF